MKPKLLSIAAIFIFVLAACPVRAGIFIDTTQDGGFFSANPAALASLQAAAADVNAVVDFSNLLAINNDVATGTAGSTTLNFNFHYTYSNPSTGAAATVSNTAIPASQITIYAGARNLTGLTLGEGGPSGIGVNITGSLGSGSAQDAISAAMANFQHRRGGGPIINTLSGAVDNANFAFNIGATLGNLWFDADTNNDGMTDNSATLNSNWHFDHTTPVAAGKSDFYSVALHEILHSIGFGIGDTWDSLANGNNWLGANAIAEAGTGTNLITSGHIAEGVMSIRLSDGGVQEAAMDPSITVGTRKSITALDVAFLKDLGYSINVTAVPEPSSILVFSLLSMVAVYRARRKTKDLESPLLERASISTATNIA